MNMHPVFELMTDIEMITPSIDTYREKLHKLQRLEHNETFVLDVEDEFAKAAVLKFLFGNLYINFLYMWEPTQKLILSHLENNPVAWSVFEYQLNEAVMNDMDSVKLMEDLNVNFECK